MNKLFAILILTSLSFFVNCQTCQDAKDFLTEDFTTSQSDAVFMVNLTEIYSIFGAKTGLANITLFNTTEQKITCHLGSTCVFIEGWNVGSNGPVEAEVLGDFGNEDDNQYITLLFTPPITDFIYKTNYDPSFPTTSWGAPILTTYGEANEVLNCYNLHEIAPISTSGGTNEYGLRGASNKNGIASVRFGGAHAAIWDLKAAKVTPTPSSTLPPIGLPTAPTIMPVASPQDSPNGSFQNAPQTEPKSTSIPSSGSIKKNVYQYLLFLLVLIL